jgi:N6-adenosine-specific RNA methylase IME4
MPVTDITAQTARAVEVHRHIRLLKRKAEETFLELAAWLHEMFEAGLWKALGYESWAQYLHDPDVNISQATDSKLRAVHRTFVLEHRMPEEDLLEAGYRRLYAAANLLGEGAAQEEVEEVVATAQTLTCVDIEQEVRRVRYRQADTVQDGRYPVLYLDPPWTTARYSEIGSVPVYAYAATTCIAYTWCPPAALSVCLGYLDSWGFSYRGDRVRTGATGTGFARSRWYNVRHEHLVIAAAGVKQGGEWQPQALLSSWMGTCSEEEGRARVLVDIDSAHPSEEKLSVFSIVQRPGWKSLAPGE